MEVPTAHRRQTLVYSASLTNGHFLSYCHYFETRHSSATKRPKYEGPGEASTEDGAWPAYIGLYVELWQRRMHVNNNSEQYIPEIAILRFMCWLTKLPLQHGSRLQVNITGRWKNKYNRQKKSVYQTFNDILYHPTETGTIDRMKMSDKLLLESEILHLSRTLQIQQLEAEDRKRKGTDGNENALHMATDVWNSLKLVLEMVDGLPLEQKRLLYQDALLNRLKIEPEELVAWIDDFDIPVRAVEYLRKLAPLVILPGNQLKKYTKEFQKQVQDACGSNYNQQKDVESLERTVSYTTSDVVKKLSCLIRAYLGAGKLKYREIDGKKITRVKISGDGFNTTKKSGMVAITINLLDVEHHHSRDSLVDLLLYEAGEKADVLQELGAGILRQMIRLMTPEGSRMVDTFSDERRGAEEGESDVTEIEGTGGRLLDEKGNPLQGVEDVRVEFFLSADQKFMNMIRGLSSCNHEYFCAWCTTRRSNIAKFYQYFENEEALLRTKDRMDSIAKKLPLVPDRKKWAKKEGCGMVTAPLLPLTLQQLVPDILHLFIRILEVVILKLANQCKKGACMAELYRVLRDIFKHPNFAFSDDTTQNGANKGGFARPTLNGDQATAILAEIERLLAMRYVLLLQLQHYTLI